MSKYDHALDLDSDNSTAHILRRIQPRSTVLEFGPASGYMTQYMKQELGCVVTCIELDPQDAETAAQYCERMIVADLDDLRWVEQLEGAQFDHIIFADVLEHLRYSSQVLNAAVQFLHERGTVLTSIPNIAHNAVIMDLLQGRFSYRNLGLLDNTHVRLFTHESILQLLAESGLSPIEWLSTVASPESTEFKQSYLHFPESVQKYLAERPEGHIYQYITVSKKTTGMIFQKADPCDEFTLAKPNLNFLQLYWEIDGSFAEVHSASQPIKSGADWQEYRFRLPATANGRLRMDPGHWSAYIELQSITIYADEDLRQVDAVYSQENGFAGLVAAHEVFELDKGEYYRFVCAAGDPYLHILPASSGVSAELSATKTVIIRMRVFDSAADAADLVKLQQDKLKLQWAELQSLRESNRAFAKQLSYAMPFIRAYRKLKDAARQVKRLWKRGWKLLKQSRQPLRDGRRLIRLAVGSIPGWHRYMKLAPYRHLEPLPMEDCWKSTGNDPQFYLQGLFPIGWVRISYQSASAQESLPLRLCWDSGTGIDERNKPILGTIQSGKPLIQHAVVCIDRWAERLRLDPGEQPAEFLLCDLRIMKVTRLFLVYRSLKMFVQMNGIINNKLHRMMRIN